MITDFKYTRLQGQVTPNTVHNPSSPRANSSPAQRQNQNGIHSLVLNS